MAIYKRGYQRYQGETTSRLTRFLALPRFAWRRLLDQKMILIALIASLFWPLGCAVFIYVANHNELWSSFSSEVGRFLDINADFFLTFMTAQSTMAVVMASLAGPGLIAPDLTNNALPLYFSRPQSRLDYVLARLATLVGMLALVTVVPALFLIVMQSGMAGWDWFSKNWHIALGVPLGMLVWVLLTSMVALASSAWVKWRVVAGGLIFAFFFVLAGAGEIVNGVMRDESGVSAKLGWFLNPLMLTRRLWIDMLGATENAQLPALLPALAMLALMCAGLGYILERKLRPVEVIK